MVLKSKAVTKILALDGFDFPSSPLSLPFLSLPSPPVLLPLFQYPCPCYSLRLPIPFPPLSSQLANIKHVTVKHAAKFGDYRPNDLLNQEPKSNRKKNSSIIIIMAGRPA